MCYKTISDKGAELAISFKQTRQCAIKVKGELRMEKIRKNLTHNCAVITKGVGRKNSRGEGAKDRK